MNRNDFEIVIVDDGSRNPPHNVLAAWQDTLDIRLIRQSNRGPGDARNTGVAHSRGNYLAFIDDDCIADTNWLLEIDRHFSKWPDSAVAGKTENGLPRNNYAEVGELIIDHLRYHSKIPGNRLLFSTLNNFAVPARLFKAVGGFDPAYSVAGEDREFCRRLSLRGFDIIDNQNIKVLHRHQMGMVGFLRLHFRYGKGTCQFHRFGGEKRKQHLLPETFFFYTSLILSPFRNRKPRAFRLFLLLIISQAAIAAGYLNLKMFNRSEARMPLRPPRNLRRDS